MDPILWQAERIRPQEAACPSTAGSQPSAPWVELVATEADWDAADPDLLRTMLSQLVLIRTFEEYVLELAGAGLVHGPAHSSIGQEGGAVGSVLALTSDDTVNGSHRGHHQFLAKALHHVEPKGVDPPSPSRRTTCATVLLRTLAEICGLDRGWSHGRGGSMHLQWKEAGAMGTNAIVGGGVPQAAGFAWSHRQAGTDAVSVTYFGDGAVNIGSTLETFNLAAAWKLPVCFFIENNRYAVSTTVDEATGEPRLSGRGPGLRHRQLEGRRHGPARGPPRDAGGGRRTCGRARGPTLVEADTYRFFHQNGAFPGSAFGYRSKEEEQEWRERDPLARPPTISTGAACSTGPSSRTSVSRAKQVLEEVGDVLLEPVPGGKPGERRIKAQEWPDPAFVDVGVRGDLSEFEDAPASSTATSRTSRCTTRSSSTPSPRCMGRRMETDDARRRAWARTSTGSTAAPTARPAVCPTGSPAACSARRSARTPSPASAAASPWTAASGPVVEFMYADFMWVAADQLFNQIGKARHMFGGEGAVPFVLRSKVAMGTGYGSQHSMDPAGIFATAPGWRIVAPSTPFDYVGLMNTALRCEDPVVVLEHVDLYNIDRRRRPSTTSTTACRSARRRSAGPGRTSPCSPTSRWSPYVLEAVEQFGQVDAEVIDLRWLDRASIDWDTIGESIRKTNQVLIAEQGARRHVVRRLAGRRDPAPVLRLARPAGRRVTGGEASPSISKVLERAAIAQTDEVVAALTEISGL